MISHKVNIKMDILSDKCCFTMKITRFSVLPLLHGHLLPPATKLGQGYFFARVCDSVHSGGLGLCPSRSLSQGVSVLGGFCPGGLCPGGSLSREVSVWGFLSRGSLCRGCLSRESLSGGSLYGGLCHRDPPYGKEWAVRILLKCIRVHEGYKGEHSGVNSLSLAAAD